ncbi:putative porin [Candidatus Methylacidithermus pantelleriae]|uniref:Uncharacterized protein n=1 Tax=Candidatus Methylacidithermus pantelleriae TaxID=2744239 RepID=A0A8J2BP46_9BACT|nr:putative porin [Candidatus Methylacidithermus pantelleriae]CAF0698300.1 conserved hypothetical protein [Candidatus Methylacidithermus pantelleriae]
MPTKLLGTKGCSWWLGTILVGIVLTPFARGQDAGPLLDKLVQKGVLTEQEAEEVRGELQQQYAESSAGKWAVNDFVKSLTLSGIARTRYDYRAGEDVLLPGDTEERERWRMIVQLAITGELVNDFFFGFRLDTSFNNRSTNVTYGGDAFKPMLFGPYGNDRFGPFTKSPNYSLNIGQVYLAWRMAEAFSLPIDEFTLITGRQPNPFYSTLLVWDADLNPESLLTVKIKQNIGDFLVFANFAPMVYSAWDPINQFGTNPANGQFVGNKQGNGNDTFLLGEQVGIEWAISRQNGVYFRVAPAVYTYTSHTFNFVPDPGTFENSIFPGNPPGVGPGNPASANGFTNFNPVNNLVVVDIPMELRWKWQGLPWRLFADYAINADGDERAKLAHQVSVLEKNPFPLHKDQDDSWLVGLEVGSAARKGDWLARVWWEHEGAYAVDPNLIDTDIFDGRVNMQGPAAQVVYQFTDAVYLVVTYNYGFRILKDTPTFGRQDLGFDNKNYPNHLDNYQLLMADLTWRF